MKGAGFLASIALYIPPLELSGCVAGLEISWLDLIGMESITIYLCSGRIGLIFSLLGLYLEFKRRAFGLQRLPIIYCSSISLL
jgi:hypothetical protein